MRILAISGSLRAASSNTRLIAALRLLAPPGVEVVVYDGLGELPHFNPDLDGDIVPGPAELRRQVGLCDGLVICSPEYAHGVAGSMKNALDWLVPSLEFPETPVALINASPHAVHADAHMRETLTLMNAHLVEAASVTIPLQGQPMTPEQIAAHPDLGPRIAAALAAFTAAIGVTEDRAS
jgi:NAD(P)H-dependent FMN reductase